MNEIDLVLNCIYKILHIIFTLEAFFLKKISIIELQVGDKTIS